MKVTMKMALALFCLLAGLLPGWAGVRHVALDSPSPDPPYASWGTAATSILQAVSGAADGDVVLVSNGVHRAWPDPVYGQSIWLTNAVTVRGFSSRDQVVVDGALNNPCFILSHPQAVVEGVTIKNGWTAGGGGGVYQVAGVLRDCVVVSNFAYSSDGGGVFMYGGSVQGCEVLWNTAEGYGGGIFCESGTEVSDSLVANNVAEAGGGGLYLHFGGTVSNCQIVLNQETGSDGGGGVLTYYGGDLSGCVISGNVSHTAYLTAGGGGVAFWYGGHLTDCEVLNNQSSSRGGGLFMYQCSNSVLERCEISGNQANLTGGGVFVDGGGTFYDAVIAGNATTNAFQGWGGGLYVLTTGTFIRCSVASNHTYSTGGGAWCNGKTRLDHCDVVGNSARYEGGGVLASAGVSIRDCVIRENDCPLGSGGGLSRNGFGAEITESCWITGNRAAFGAGVYCFGAGTGMVRNCVVSGNVATNDGGGAYLDNGGFLQNCTISGNHAANGGGVMRSGGGVRNSIVQGNTSANTASNMAGGGAYFFSCAAPLPSGSGNVAADPRFAAGYELDADSPCIDAGTTTGAPPVDIRGVARPLNGLNSGTARYDMGAYEYAHPFADTDGDHMSDRDEIRAGTSPVNPSDVFALRSSASSAGGQPEIRWSSVSGKFYRVERSVDLLLDFPGVVASNIMADPPLNVLVDSAAEGGGPWMYRIVLEE